MARRVHTFSYFMSPKEKKRGVRAFMTRDEGAAFEILRALLGQGYELGESLLNPPPSDPPAIEPSRKDLLRVDLSRVREGDLILVATRPPMNDLEEGARKQVARGCTDLEHVLFQEWGPYLETCSRRLIELRPAVAQALPAEFAGLAGMRFRQRGAGADFYELNERRGRGFKSYVSEERHTAVFLLRTGPVTEKKVDLVWAFGVDGITTLAWAYHLGHGLKHLLERPGFVLARMTCRDVPERATSRAWAEEWKVEIVLEQLEDEHRGEPQDAKILQPAAPPSRLRRPRGVAASGSSAEVDEAKPERSVKTKVRPQGQARGKRKVQPEDDPRAAVKAERKANAKVKSNAKANTKTETSAGPEAKTRPKAKAPAAPQTEPQGEPTAGRLARRKRAR